MNAVAVLHPGEMGAAIGACLAARGLRVVWASDGRGAATRSRAGAAGIEDLGSLERALGAADIVLSVCPPHGALALAREVAGLGFRGIYVDANAIFFAGSNLQAVPLQGPPGAASALKACYAAWTKGATALLAAIRALAGHEGVEPALLEEWKLSQPELPKRSEAVTVQARKAWRWIGEMEEIAASFQAAGLPPGFHLAAAEVYRKLERFKDGGAPPALGEVTAAMRRGARRKASPGESRRRSAPREPQRRAHFKFGTAAKRLR